MDKVKAEDPYYLTRDQGESDRLEAQHQWLIKNLGYLIHPNFEHKLPHNARIADIATGTGAWLRDVAKEYPCSWQLEGFDISGDQFPAQENLAPNIKLHVFNCKEPLPAEFNDTYDLVNIRFMTAAMGFDDWAKVTANVLQILKPGGRVQWLEGDFVQGKRVMCSRPGVKTEALTQGFAKFLDIPFAQFAYGNANLDRIMAKVGLSQVHRESMSSDRLPETRKPSSPYMIGAWYAAMMNMARHKVPDAWTESKIVAWRELMMQEIEDGAYLRFDLNMFLAVKPF